MHSYILIFTCKEGVNVYPFQTKAKLNTKILAPSMKKVLVDFFNIGYNEKRLDEYLELVEVKTIPELKFYQNGTNRASAE